MKYVDFHLQIATADGAYHAQVIDAPAGDGKGAVRMRPLSPETGSPRESGGALFRAVFQGEVKALWDQSVAKLGPGHGLRLKLRLEGVPDLVALPWECLYDAEHKAFLALDVETPVVRYLQVGVHPLPVQAPRPVRILVLTSHAEGASPLNAEGEILALRKALAPLRWRVRIKHLDRPTLGELQNALRTCQIFHFIGHGRYDADTEAGALVLRGAGGQPELVDVHRLVGLLPSRHNLRLAFLNSCQGAQISTADAFGGIAQSLIQKGVPAVVAMRHDVDDEAAVVFAKNCYEALVGGAAIHEAVTLGRKAISADHGDAWATPALYVHQDLEVIPPPPPRWLLPVAASLLLAGLAAFAVWWIPRFNAARVCPSPPGLDMTFAEIPGGRFQMGGSPRPGLEAPIHDVTLTQPFCLDKKEITQRQWKAVMHGNPSAAQGDDLPVENVSWNDIQEFLKRLRKQDPAGQYRLPTEAQWEYAAGGLDHSMYGYGNDPAELLKYGNCHGGGRTAPVGSFLPTGWGLYDLHGNVAEWTADLEQYQSGPAVDPKGSPRNDSLGIRGGSFEDEPEQCRAASREIALPDSRSPDLGFRIVRDPVH